MIQTFPAIRLIKVSRDRKCQWEMYTLESYILLVREALDKINLIPRSCVKFEYPNDLLFKPTELKLPVAVSR